MGIRTIWRWLGDISLLQWILQTAPSLAVGIMTYFDGQPLWLIIFVTVGLFALLTIIIQRWFPNFGKSSEPPAPESDEGISTKARFPSTGIVFKGGDNSSVVGNTASGFDTGMNVETGKGGFLAGNKAVAPSMKLSDLNQQTRAELADQIRYMMDSIRTTPMWNPHDSPSLLSAFNVITQRMGYILGNENAVWDLNKKITNRVNENKSLTTLTPDDPEFFDHPDIKRNWHLVNQSFDAYHKILDDLENTIISLENGGQL